MIMSVTKIFREFKSTAKLLKTWTSGLKIFIKYFCKTFMEKFDSKTAKHSKIRIKGIIRIDLA